MSNIEEIEKIYILYRDGAMMFANDRIAKFMELSVNSLKDLHEETARLGKEIAELKIGEMQKFHDKVFERNSKAEPVMTKKEFNEYVKKDMEYPYEQDE